VEDEGRKAQGTQGEVLTLRVIRRAVVSGIVIGVILALLILFLVNGYRGYLLFWASLVALAPGSILASMILAVIADVWLPWSAHVYTETAGFAWSALGLSFLFWWLLAFGGLTLWQRRRSKMPRQ